MPGPGAQFWKRAWIMENNGYFSALLNGNGSKPQHSKTSSMISYFFFSSFSNVPSKFAGKWLLKQTIFKCLSLEFFVLVFPTKNGKKNILFEFFFLDYNNNKKTFSNKLAFSLAVSPLSVISSWDSTGLCGQLTFSFDYFLPYFLNVLFIYPAYSL